MGREILFRGKRKDTGEWVEGSYVLLEEIHFIIPPQLEIDDNLCAEVPKFVLIQPETLGQYTGVEDKNGKPIYEGDIVTNKWCFYHEHSVVKFGEHKHWTMTSDYKCGMLGFYVDHPYDEHQSQRKDLMYFAGNCEVVGNIHDNPELLEGK